MAAMLDASEVVTHPFVVGELACGQLRNREEVLELLDSLPTTPVATDAEVRAFIERRSLMRRGLGYVDVHLLAAAAIGSEVRLWTADRGLKLAAEHLGIAE